MPKFAEVVYADENSKLITKYVDETARDPNKAYIVSQGDTSLIIANGNRSSVGVNMGSAGNAFILDGGKATYSVNKMGALKIVDPDIVGVFAGIFNNNDVIEIDGVNVSVRPEGKPARIMGKEALNYLQNNYGIGVLSNEDVPVTEPDAQAIKQEYGIDTIA